MAELDVTSRERTLRQRQLDVESEVRSAVRELVRIRKSIELQRKGVEVAEQQRRLATLRYQRGLASNFDVVDAEGSLVVARSALVGLLTSYQVRARRPPARHGHPGRGQGLRAMSTPSGRPEAIAWHARWARRGRASRSWLVSAAREARPWLRRENWTRREPALTRWWPRPASGRARPRP